jgi:ABC-2 type transport system ATP-binding protein
MPAIKSASVSIRDLAKRYGRVEALSGVSLEIGQGEVFGLLGRNGAGKTSVLECVLGLRRPDGGTVAIEGIDAQLSPGEARQICGALIQGATLQDRVTPLQALRLFASFYRHSLSAEGLIEKVGLTDKADAPFVSLSAGQRQRLFLALAYVNDPRVVILDEPSAGLDPDAKRGLRDSIRVMKDEGRTVLVSTHDLEEAHLLCDRIAVIERGRIAATGTPEELIAGCSVPPRVWVVTRPAINLSSTPQPSFTSTCRREGEGWWLGTSNPEATVAALFERARLEGAEIIELKFARASLEDAFFAVTGRPWEGFEV